MERKVPKYEYHKIREHKGEIHIFHKPMDLLISSIIIITTLSYMWSFSSFIVDYKSVIYFFFVVVKGFMSVESIVIRIILI